MRASSERGGAAAAPRARRDEKTKQAAPTPDAPRAAVEEETSMPIGSNLFAALLGLVDHFGAASLDGGVAFVIFAALRALLVMVDCWGTPEVERIYGVAL